MPSSAHRPELLAAAGLAFLASGAGCGGGNGASPPADGAPTFRPGAPWPWTGGRAVQVTIDASRSLRPVTPLHFGMNTSWWSGKDWSLDPDRLAKARQMGAKLWRFPGGSYSDQYIWDGNWGTHGTASDGTDLTVSTQPEFLRTDDFIELCRQLNAQAIVTANYGLARTGTLAEATDLAARWVRRFNVERGFPVQYWEIGNEMYGSWEPGNTVPGLPPLTGDAYGRDFRAMAQAMKAVDPSIKVGAPALPQNWGPSFGAWTPAMLSEIKDDADFLVVHEYFSPGDNDSTFAGLGAIRQNIETLNAMTAATTARAAPFPVALTEFNVTLSGPPTVELINGIVTGEIIGEAIASGYFALNYWDWKNEWGEAEGGDHGMLAFKDPAVPDGTPRPSYYGFAVATRAYGDHTVEAASVDPRLKVYASRFGTGPLGVMIANEIETAAALTFSISGFAPQRANGWVLTGENLNATAVTFNGAAGPAAGGGPFPIDELDPYAVQLSSNETFTLTVPGGSLTGLVLF